MTVADLIDRIESDFTCELGAPWRWADAWMTKPYSLITFQGTEHTGCQCVITALARYKGRPGTKPKLYWRWADKVRYDDGEIQTRVYLDGNPMPNIGNPSNPRGRPTVGQMRIAA
jgi:hypothetical protein